MARWPVAASEGISPSHPSSLPRMLPPPFRPCFPKLHHEHLSRRGAPVRFRRAQASGRFSPLPQHAIVHGAKADAELVHIERGLGVEHGIDSSFADRSRDLSTRKVEIAGIAPSPNGLWINQVGASLEPVPVRADRRIRLDEPAAWRPGASLTEWWAGTLKPAKTGLGGQNGLSGQKTSRSEASIFRRGPLPRYPPFPAFCISRVRSSAASVPRRQHNILNPLVRVRISCAPG
jgi:hypothetical protein